MHGLFSHGCLSLPRQLNVCCHPCSLVLRQTALLPKSGQSAALNPFTSLSRKMAPIFPPSALPFQIHPNFSMGTTTCDKKSTREKMGRRPGGSDERGGRSIDRRNLLLSQERAGFCPQNGYISSRLKNAQSTLQVNQQGD